MLTTQEEHVYHRRSDRRCHKHIQSEVFLQAWSRILPDSPNRCIQIDRDTTDFSYTFGSDRNQEIWNQAEMFLTHAFLYLRKEGKWERTGWK